MTTMDDARAQSIANRISAGLTFTFVGPFIGAIAVFLFVCIAALFTSPASVQSLLQFLLFVVAMGYVFGIGPALMTGLVYALLPRALQRFVFAPFYGLAAVWLFYEILEVTGQNYDQIGQNPLMLGAGAVAALACAWFVRADLSAHQTHTAQPPG